MRQIAAGKGGVFIYDVHVREQLLTRLLASLQCEHRLASTEEAKLGRQWRLRLNRVLQVACQHLRYCSGTSPIASMDGLTELDEFRSVLLCTYESSNHENAYDGI